jgi:hypothetical protein
MNASSSLTTPGSPFLNAPSPAPALRLSRSWLAAQGRLPLAFMGLGLAWLAIATLLLALQPRLLVLPHNAPAVVALTHAWVLGVFVTVATGAIYQLAPVALGTTLWSERTGWWHFIFHTTGVPGMVYAFWHGDLRWVGLFGTLVGSGILLFALNAWATIHRSGKRDAVAWSLTLAASWLTLTVLAGLILVANRLWNFWATDPLALLRAHAHLGLVGFFVTLLQGVTFRLVPMFTLGDVPNWRPVRTGLWLSQIGLLGLIPALAWHAGYVAAIFGTLIFAGMISSGWALKQTLTTRKKRFLDPGVRAFLRGLAGLIMAAVAGVLLVWPTTVGNSAPGGFSAMVYAVVLFAGALVPIIAGMMCKIVPFLTWMRAYGPKIGRGPTPAASALTKPRLEKWAFILQGAAVLPLVAGAWWLNVPLLNFGAWLLTVGVGLFIADMMGVMRHLWWPSTGAPSVISKGSRL